MPVIVLPDNGVPVFTTVTGTLRSCVESSPSWPFRLRPQAAMVPSEQSAMLCRSPVVMDTTVLPEMAVFDVLTFNGSKEP